MTRMNKVFLNKLDTCTCIYICSLWYTCMMYVCEASCVHMCTILYVWTYVHVCEASCITIQYYMAYMTYSACTLGVCIHIHLLYIYMYTYMYVHHICCTIRTNTFSVHMYESYMYNSNK